MANRDTIGTNETELFGALQTDPKLMPEGGLWLEKEPNSYETFGTTQTKVARSPINAGRMKKKATLVGTTSDVAFNQDLTAENALQDFESFLYAARRSKGDVTSTTIVADGYTVPSGGGAFKAGDLIIVEGENVNPVNLGVKLLTSDGTSAKVLFATTPETGAKVRIRKCGHEFDAGDASIAVAGGVPKLTIADFDATALGLLPGEIVYLGADLTANRFAQSANQGWCRVLKVEPTGISFDKTDEEFVNDNGSGKSIRLWFGTVIKNERDPKDQKLFAWAFRRLLGRPDTGSEVVQSEVILGNVANELTINMPEEEKITFDVSYNGRRHELFEDDDEVDPTGTFQRVTEADAISTAKDSRRLRLGVYLKRGDAFSSKPTLLFPAFNEFEISINNNVSVNKAITYEGAYSHTPGFFEVMCSGNAYFNDVKGIDALNNNRDLTLDFAAAKDNKGFAIDLPMIGASTDGPELEQNQAIMLELEGEAAEGVKYNSAFNHAMLVVFFPYLPDAAQD